MANSINFHHLHYFWTVAKEGHLTRAARQLHVSQSALSTQIRQLEERLGGPLFLREGRKLHLTELGTLVLGYAEAIFSLGNELQAVVGSGRARRGQPVRVGAVATLSRNFQENFLRPALTGGDLRLVLESGSLEELLQRLRVHRLDLVLSNRPATGEPGEAWHCRRIARQSVCLVGQPRDDAAPFRFPASLSGARLVLPGRSSDIRVQFDLLCEELQVGYEVFAEVDDMAMLRLLARDSGEVAVVPEVVVQDELASGRLQKYCELPGIFENFYAITARRHFLPPELRVLLDEGPVAAREAVLKRRESTADSV